MPSIDIYLLKLHLLRKLSVINIIKLRNQKRRAEETRVKCFMVTSSAMIKWNKLWNPYCMEVLGLLQQVHIRATKFFRGMTTSPMKSNWVWGLFSLKKRRLQEDFAAICQYSRGNYKKYEDRFLSRISRNRVRGSGFN